MEKSPNTVKKLRNRLPHSLAKSIPERFMSCSSSPLSTRAGRSPCLPTTDSVRSTPLSWSPRLETRMLDSLPSLSSSSCARSSDMLTTTSY